MRTSEQGFTPHSPFYKLHYCKVEPNNLDDTFYEIRFFCLPLVATMSKEDVIVSAEQVEYRARAEWYTLKSVRDRCI